MSVSVSSLTNAWSARSGREKALLLALALGVLAVAGWYGVVTPMQRMDRAAEARLALATSRLGEVEAAARTDLTRIGLAGDLEAEIAASAVAAGVTLDQRRRDSADELTVWIASIAPADFYGWARRLDTDLGVAVTNLTATNIGGGRMQVEALLARSG
jgi:type II secretory pathway component PulM